VAMWIIERIGITNPELSLGVRPGAMHDRCKGKGLLRLNNPMPGFPYNS